MLFPFVSKEAFILLHMNGALSDSSVVVDHLSLLAIKSKITEDSQGALRSWNDSLPFCRWQGVTCSRRHQRVTGLNLTGKSLVGTLSPFLGNLSFLRFIIFKSNQLHGSIPPEIGRLSRLQQLSLPNNSFTGEIPSNISSCSKLSYINLSTNMLSGKLSVPSSLLMIKVLGLDRNKFTGGIPPAIGNLTSLEQIFLSYCPLGGSIPDSFSQLKNLQMLGLGENGLVGSFPSFLFNLSTLELLNFPENQLHGRLPSNLCLSQPHLKRLELGNNRFIGLLPPSISNCSELETFDVADNDFKGEITVDFGKLQNLWYVGLGPNNFESKGLDGMIFFDSLSNCSNLESVELVNMQLRGVLPNSLGNFSSKLNYLGLAFNYISGSIPSSIGNLFSLTTLNLGVNNFTGMVPESIGKLQNLVELYLLVNHFTGIIPKSIGNLSSVVDLRLGRNRLEGSIPSAFGRCKKLILLEFYENNLSGIVPKEVFQLPSLSIVLDLSRNNLSGVLPQEIGNLRVLGSLDLSENHFSGELPSSFSSCISLERLNLSNNFFHGSLPESLSFLKALEYLNLSRNNFSGHVPKFLQQIPLKNIDLSFNDFEGDIYVKGVFANTSVISVIGNPRLCGGKPELHLPKCKSSNDKKRGKLSLRVVVAISLSSVVAGLILVFYCCGGKKKKEKPSESMHAKSFEKISYDRLFKATEGFSSANLIGTGSFASVYKGVIDGIGESVAIKVLNLQQRGGSKSFIAECEALRNIRHRNLVKVITSCSSIDHQGNDFKALVYDFMPNGNLQSWLYSFTTTNHIPHDQLYQRISIAKDVAYALDYLHYRCGNVVVHCDLKPSNILLDADMVAHVGDFGLAKILSLEELSNANESSSTLMRGTIGYAPPEYGLGNEVSTSGDIYSYGILLLEMLTGKKPVNPMFHDGLSLHSYVRTALADGFVLEVVDPMLLHDDVDETCLISLVKIGVQCSSESSQDRMDIETILRELARW